MRTLSFIDYINQSDTGFGAQLTVDLGIDGKNMAAESCRARRAQHKVQCALFLCGDARAAQVRRCRPTVRCYGVDPETYRVLAVIGIDQS